MNAIELLANRVTGVHGALVGLVADAATVDWATPVRPGTSPVGLTLWHVPRTQDWLVNTCVRGGEEVADRPEFAALPDPDVFGFGTGLSPEQASTAAAGVKPDLLLDYADAVRADIVSWLGELSETDLDVPATDFMGRQQRRPAYCTEAALEEVAHLPDLPVGVLLLRPVMSHVLMHLGEVDTLVQLAR